jgi:hypothetical protein
MMNISGLKEHIKKSLEEVFPFLKERVIWRKFALKNS